MNILKLCLTLFPPCIHFLDIITLEMTKFNKKKLEIKGGCAEKTEYLKW